MILGGEMDVCAGNNEAIPWSSGGLGSFAHELHFHQVVRVRPLQKGKMRRCLLRALPLGVHKRPKYEMSKCCAPFACNVAPAIPCPGWGVPL